MEINNLINNYIINKTMAEQSKKLKVFTGKTLRNVVDYANELEITKKELVNIVLDNGMWRLIYYDK